ncbi:MAG: rod shape-determining protein MreD [Proteobacteria bacterium]|nr:rod shape-determining protein MreD [Pseudomonadota bacterium]
MLNKNTGGWILFISLLIAFLLTALPLPHWADDWRPAWVAMVLIYWCMALPERIGIGIAWCLGLLLDVQQGALLGQNALGLALIAYFVIQIHKRFRLFPLVQQSCLVGFIIIFYLLISSWVTGIMGIPPETWTYWMPAISSMVLWPWLFVILRDIRRQYNVT